VGAPGELLQCSNSDLLVRIERLKLSHSEPISLEVSYIPYNLAQDVLNEDLENFIIYDYLRDRGVVLSDSRMYIQPYILNNHESKVLGISKEQPVFLWERLSYKGEDRIPVELTQMIIRSDMRRFYIQFGL